MKPVLVLMMVMAFIVTGGIGCVESPETARKELGQMGIEYSEAAFLGRVKNNDKRAVLLFLAAEMNPNVKADDGGTALMLAASNGHTEIVEALLAKGAEVDVKTETGETALIFAAFYGRAEIVEALLA